MKKDFYNWNFLKKNLDQRQSPPTFNQREVWWTHLGLNIGDEENGKNKKYHRPVLVVRKFNNHIFLGVPLTTQIKNNPYYHKITFKEKTQCIMLSQLRIFDCKRLERKIGKVTNTNLDKIRNALKEII